MITYHILFKSFVWCTSRIW